MYFIGELWTPNPKPETVSGGETASAGWSEPLEPRLGTFLFFFFLPRAWKTNSEQNGPVLSAVFGGPRSVYASSKRLGTCPGAITEREFFIGDLLV